MLIGAVLAGATKNEQDIISQVAKDVGLAFQIQDDILDVAGDSAVLGKPVGSDEKNEKTTYVTIRGLEKASEDVAEISARALKNMDALVVKNQYLNGLLKYLIHREK